MEQPTFGELEYESKKRKTRREIFLERMDGLIPWRQLEARIRPHYPKAGRGRRPYPLSVMLRIYCVQLFYNLTDRVLAVYGQIVASCYADGKMEWILEQACNSGWGIHARSGAEIIIWLTCRSKTCRILSMSDCVATRAKTTAQ